MAAGKATSNVAGVEEKWRYCSVCRRNHDEGRKHIFTKQHKNRLSVILSKFTKKVRSARRLLAKPSALDGELEPGAKMWCYCCEREIDKHVTDGSLTLEWGGLIEHMADPDHHKKSRHFWWVNGAESTQLQMFLLFPAEYRRYRDLAAEALKLIERKRETTKKKDAEKAELQQTHAASTTLEPVAHFSGDPSRGFWNQPTGPTIPTIPPPQQQAGPSGLILPAMANHHHLPSLSGKSSRPAPVKVTVGAYGENLTTLERKEPVDVRIGNIHSGATPPWLRGDGDEDTASSSVSGGDSSAVTFGPSLDEFIKHKERMRRAGKNPKRVGADFHLKLTSQKQDSDDWLPSFGRVWNYGPRVDSKSEFLKEKDRSKTVPPLSAGPSTAAAAASNQTSVNSSGAGSSLSRPQELASMSSTPQIKPYTRKRPRDTSNGIFSASSKVFVPSSSSIEGDCSIGGGAVRSEAVTVSLEVKPYVRKRKIKPKINEKSTS